eukprot:scaffold112_cov282-Prasinococcus_capsulatus_cf.AAC.17
MSLLPSWLFAGRRARRLASAGRPRHLASRDQEGQRNGMIFVEVVEAYLVEEAERQLGDGGPAFNPHGR